MNTIKLPEQMPPKISLQRVFITGVSNGIGLALATLYLSKGWTVYGTARHKPVALSQYEKFIFKSCDLINTSNIEQLFEDEFSSIKTLGVSIVHLNAGVSANAPARAEDYSDTDILQTLTINALVNKTILDILLAFDIRPDIVVASSSMAAIRYRAGMLPYSLSKAALNALCGVYSRENTDIFFAVLGMCNVQTNLSQAIVSNSRISEFPEHIKLKERFSQPGYVVSPEVRAQGIYQLIVEQHCAGLISGQFFEMRKLSY
ncbi:SDR family oxidoreductase [Brenneria rubrifaciens]|uniref:SDR family oxidoreductase n=1 Tax=Brenneria rubrifaciens TaxID=55213 RepID=A0A4P8QLD1_9GAMM|nr:SDR family oxidoreductase [Brenneria rubrifaciens]QCR07678.1 SDR family oxidoreductase [Brenneria rubrifaciens]